MHRVQPGTPPRRASHRFRTLESEPSRQPMFQGTRSTQKQTNAVTRPTTVCGKFFKGVTPTSNNLIYATKGDSGCTGVKQLQVSALLARQHRGQLKDFLTSGHVFEDLSPAKPSHRELASALPRQLLHLLCVLPAWELQRSTFEISERFLCMLLGSLSPLEKNNCRCPANPNITISSCHCRRTTQQ